MPPQHFLVPLDFSAYSTQALDYAIALAHPLHARLTLLHVIQPLFMGGDDIDVRLPEPSCRSWTPSSPAAWRPRMVKIFERVALLVVTSLIRVSRSYQYRGNCQCQTKLLSADRQPFQRTADLATRAGHWPV